MPQWPNVTVLHYRNTRGINAYGDEAPKLPVMPLKTALEKRWVTDSHMTGYLLHHDASEVYAKDGEMVRVNKPSLESLASEGFSVLTSVVLVDLDLPKHIFWDEEQLALFLEAFETASTQDEMLKQWHAFYSTRSGARLVYALDRPVPCPAAEGVIRGILFRISQTALGPYTDTSTYDFTRLFRLPQVTRDGHPSWEQDYCQLEFQPEQPLLATKNIAPILTTAKKYGKVLRITGDCPGADEAKAWLTITSETTGQPVMSEWFKRARRQLKGRESADLIDGKLDLETWPDGRNNGLRFCVGQAVNLLYLLPGADPKLLFALFVDPCEQLEARTGDDDGKSWLDILWHLTTHCWEKESASVQVEDAKREHVALQSGKISLDILTGMRKWCSCSIVHGPEVEAMLWLNRYLIVFCDGLYYVMRPDGYYDSVGVGVPNLVARIRELGMQGIIPIEEEVVVGGQVVRRDVPTQRIINRHVSVVPYCAGIVGTAGSVVRDLGTDSATFQFKMYSRRTDIDPQWSDEVDAWMAATFGEAYEEVKNWIAHALNFEGGGICALSINAPPGIGKKLLLEGLAECIDTKAVASAKELTGRFQSMMLSTPFLSINEGLPKVSRDGSNDPADSFRALIAGDTHKVEQKGRGIISIHNPMRIVITANNDRILQDLYGNQDLSPQDRAALGKRILHFDLGAEGEAWLRRKGGMAYTGNPQRRWIRGDDGRQSHWLMARHFLMLYKHRLPVPIGNRLLVEGDPDSGIVREMAVSSGGSPEIIEVIVRMTEESQFPPGIQLKNGGVYVSALGVRDFHTQLFPFEKKLRLSRVSSVLRGLSSRSASQARQLHGPGTPKVRAWKIDTNILMRHADTNGHPCERLKDLVSSNANANE